MMKLSRALAFLLLFLSSAADSTALRQPVVVMAYATSSTAESVPVVCLLDPLCKGSWRPGSKDSGVDEGIYVQLDEPVQIDFIEVGYVVDPVENPTEMLGRGCVFAFSYYVNGKTTDTEGSPYIVGSENYSSKCGEKRIARIGSRGMNFSLATIETPLQSFYFKVGRGYGKQLIQSGVFSIQFIRDGKPIPLTLPVKVAATVAASSVLSPATAYSPAFLFDSQLTSAWATDGKVTDGTGQHLDIRLKSAKDVRGLVIWTGYQRSETHYQANSRPRKIVARINDGEPVELELADRIGDQTILFKNPFLKARNIDLEIRSVYPGTKYKDLVISEIQLLGRSSQRISLGVEMPRPSVPAEFEALMDRSWSTLLHDVISEETECVERCYNRSFRLRSNGSFVIYSDFDDVPSMGGRLDARVLEGNWEPGKNGLRLFGKKYATTLRSSEYLSESEQHPQPAIFQTEFTYQNYSNMPEKDRLSVLGLVWAARGGTADDSEGTIYWHSPLRDYVGFSASSRKALLKLVDAELAKKGAIWVKSSVISDIFLPSDSVPPCYTGC